MMEQAGHPRRGRTLQNLPSSPLFLLFSVFLLLSSLLLGQQPPANGLGGGAISFAQAHLNGFTGDGFQSSQ